MTSLKTGSASARGEKLELKAQSRQHKIHFVLLHCRRKAVQKHIASNSLTQSDHQIKFSLISSPKTLLSPTKSLLLTTVVRFNVAVPILDRVLLVLHDVLEAVSCNQGTH